MIDAAALLSWYRSVRRDLPWRRIVSPYRTLVSELMCQQTRVETVLPYFERFMVAFPTVNDLALADERRVLQLWAGLGYYSRARNLQKAAIAVVAQGGFPSSLAGLLALPGVGPYTAGAIASTALGLDAPLADGNVERVVARVLALDVSGAKLRRDVWAEAERGMWAAVALEPGSAGDFNQGMMELGALVCTPRAPACGACPLGAGCAGRGEPLRFPVKSLKKVSPTIRAAALLRVVGGEVWLARRPPGLLGGLWEPPISASWIGAGAAVGVRVGDCVHVFSHRRLEVEVRRAGRVEWASGGLASEGMALPEPVLAAGPYVEEAWLPVADIDRPGGPPFSALARKVLAWLDQPEIPADTNSTQASSASSSRPSRVMSTLGGSSSNRG
ncbi:MAG: A/G-specific adenine glycosylase [Myxococcales bacterium]|nr:A/G-specific adenine glycosylase [Myxococcales bacterium]